MPTIDEILREQEGRYRSHQGETMWPAFFGILFGVLFSLVSVVVTQNLVARELRFDPQLGRPTVGSLYLSPLSTLSWRIRCFSSREPGFAHPIPACESEPSRSAVMGTFTQYDHTIAIVSIASLIICIFAGVAVRERRRARTSVKTHGDATWAKFADISERGLILSQRKQIANEKGKIGFPLGVLRHNGRTYYVYTNPEQALGVMLVGPPGSGKTACFYIPHLLSDPVSKFIYDPSLEMWRKTAGWRSLPKSKGGAGNICILFAPTRPEVSCHINPCDSVKWETPDETRTLQNLWKRFLDFADKAAEGSEAHWIATGTVLGECSLAHLHYVDPDNCTFEGVYNFLAQFEDSKDPKGPTGVDLALREIMSTDHRQGREDLDHIFRDHEGNQWDVHAYAERSAKETLQKAPNEKSGVISTLRRFLHVFRERNVAEVTRTSDFSLEDLMLNDKPVSLYFGVPPSDIQRLRPLVGLLVNLITFTHMDDKALDLETGEFRYKHPLDLDLDEAKQLGKQEQAFTSWSMARKYGIAPNLGYQDISQVWSAAGGQNEEAVTSVSNVKVFLRPNKPETAKWISHEVLGKTTGEDFNRNYSGNRLGYLHNASTQRSFISTDLMSPQRLMEMEPHVALVKAGDLAPFLVETLYYESDPQLLARSQIPPPKRSASIPMARRAYRPPWWRPEGDEVVTEAAAIVSDAQNGAALSPAPPAEAQASADSRVQHERNPAKELVGAVAAQPSSGASQAIDEPENAPVMGTADERAEKTVTDESSRAIEDALSGLFFESDPGPDIGSASDPMNG